MVSQEFTVDLNKPLVFQVSYTVTMPSDFYVPHITKIDQTILCYVNVESYEFYM